MENSRHVSVMLEEVMEYLKVAEGGEFLDCTLGGAGHTEAIARAKPGNRVVAIDRDVRAIERAKPKLADLNVEIRHGDWRSLESAVNGGKFQGILADLGLSSDQLHEKRGFSFRDEDSLDMRMDQSAGVSASQIVNEKSLGELTSLLRRGGVSKDPKRIANAIVKARPINSTKQLAEIIAGAIPVREQKKGIHPATVALQAIRIAVNQEIENIEALLKAAPKLAKKQARFVAISFHSLEDQLIAKQMRDWDQGCTCPRTRPCECGKKKLGFLLTKKALTPSAEEIARNPAARSALMRVFEFIGE